MGLDSAFAAAYGASGKRLLLHTLGFVYKTKYVSGKDKREDQQEFVKRFREFMAHKSAETPLYFTDATHPTRNSIPAYGWICGGKERACR